MIVCSKTIKFVHKDSTLCDGHAPAKDRGLFLKA